LTMRSRHQAGLVLLVVGLAHGEEYVSRQRRAHIGPGHHDTPGHPDLHSGEHCVDVSFWGNLTYEPSQETCCETTLQKHCHDKEEKVCGDVTNLECDLLAYTECDLVMTRQPFNTDKMVEDHYQVWACDEGVKNVTHLKQLPECKNVTRMNCVQLWETDSRGQKVKKNVDCKPVTWQECKLKDVYKNLEVPDVNCYPSNKVPFNKCQKDVPQEFMVTSLVCEIKQKVTCVPKTLQKCSKVTYRECTEIPSKECKPSKVLVPTQEYVHQEVCLLGDGGPTSGSSGYQPPGRGGNFGRDRRGREGKPSLSDLKAGRG